MGGWRKGPLILEINTWPWLTGMGPDGLQPLCMDQVPDREWDRLADLGLDAVWLMGVWTRSPASKDTALNNPMLREDFGRALPDWTPDDVLGSAYSVAGYRVDRRLGGDAALAAARRALEKRGLGLILDFVPNHVALDHPWPNQQPQFFLQGTPEEASSAPGDFVEVGSHFLAKGRDPYYPPWDDTVQVNAFSPGYRVLARDTLHQLADMCDGVRCDMAMLLLTDVFRRTWEERAGQAPEEEFWTEVIGPIKEYRSDFLFIAEAYWDLESRLQELGFDYCYDKRLYDRLRHDSAGSVRDHLLADLSYQDRLIRFIENHDEARAALAFGPERIPAAFIAAMTLPGARLIHQGQMEGGLTRLPVFLRRAPRAPGDEELDHFYRSVMRQAYRPLFREGEWRLCPTRGWPDNDTHDSLLAWTWELGDQRSVVVVNHSSHPSQGRLLLPWDRWRDDTVLLADPLAGNAFYRDAVELTGEGLFVDLPAWGWHFLVYEQ